MHRIAVPRPRGKLHEGRSRARSPRESRRGRDPSNGWDWEQKHEKHSTLPSVLVLKSQDQYS